MNDIEDTSTQKKSKAQGDNYINNKEFSQAVHEHVLGVKDDLANEKEPRVISNYIGECFLKIATGLSRRPNFINYSYREDMVMDAVENCLLRINNFNIDFVTRTGKANAFSYFTQFCFYAFLRRIEKEKKQAKIKQRVIDTGSIGAFADFADGSTTQLGECMVERMRNRNAFYKESLGPKPEDVELPPKRRGRKRKNAVKVSEVDLTDFTE